MKPGRDEKNWHEFKDEFDPNAEAQSAPEAFAVRRWLCLRRAGPKPFTTNGEAKKDSNSCFFELESKLVDRYKPGGPICRYSFGGAGFLSRDSTLPLQRQAHSPTPAGQTGHVPAVWRG